MRCMFRKMVGMALLSGMLALFSFVHPYHVAVTSVHYFKKLQQVNIEIKVFYHDLEPAVNKFAGVDIDIKNHSNVKQRDSLVNAYVEKHFTIHNDGKLVEQSKVGVSFKDEYIFVKLLMKNFVPGKLKFTNTICYEVEKTQTNLFHFKSTDMKSSKKIVNPEAVVEFVFN